MTKVVKVSVGPDGVIKFEADGFTGSSCETATAFLEQALAGKASDKTLKPSYYETDTNISDEIKLRF